MKQIVVGIALWATLGAAHSQLSIEPATPKAFFEVHVKASGASFGKDKMGRNDFYDPARTTVTMVANKITVSPLMVGGDDFSAQLGTINLDQALGALPPGTYVVEVIKRATGDGSPGPVGSEITFTIPPRAETAPVANHSDIWWTTSESGWGLNLIHHGSQQIFATLFVYGPDSKPTWYVLPGGTFTGARVFQGTLYKTLGPFFAGQFNPALVTTTPAGTAVIQFDQRDPNSASINFTIDGQPFAKQIRRMTF